MKHPDAMYSREESSPDGSLHICYNYSEGERTPAIMEPCVTLVATGEVLFDLWGIRLNGHLDEFTADGFRLTANDNYNLATILVQADVQSKTFTRVNDPAPARPLSILRETLFGIFERLRSEREAASSPSGSSRPSFISRLTGWFN